MSVMIATTNPCIHIYVNSSQTVLNTTDPSPHSSHVWAASLAIQRSLSSKGCLPLWMEWVIILVCPRSPSCEKMLAKFLRRAQIFCFCSALMSTQPLSYNYCKCCQTRWHTLFLNTLVTSLQETRWVLFPIIYGSEERFITLE